MFVGKTALATLDETSGVSKTSSTFTV